MEPTLQTPVASSETAPPPPPYRQYSTGQMTGATVLGSPLAGCWLLASKNYERLGDRSARNRTWVTGVLATVGAMTLGFFLPDNFPNSIIAISYTLGFREHFRLSQGTVFKKHIAAGGGRYSNWRAAGIGLLFLVGLLVVIGGVALLLPGELF